MNNIAAPRKTPSSHTLVRSNPVLNRLSRVTDRGASDSATYAGIASKTTWFLLITLVGIVAQLIVKAAFASAPVWQTITLRDTFTFTLTKTETIIVGAVLVVGFICELLGIFAHRTVPVTGTIYSASQGYVISFLVFKVLTGYEYLGLEALLLTVAVVLGMSWLYTSGVIQVDGKFRAVLLALIVGSIGVGLLSFLGSLIPATRPFVQQMTQNPTITILVDVVGLVIAALFLISDFAMVDTCVKQRYPKEYEWSAAFGLVFTVIWIYLKILDLLMEFAGKKDD